MPLAPGTRLGAYDIVALIGAGGMGEVYRARDTRLKRDVALKLLPQSFAADPERLARFQREAEVLASLNHPNIAAIHGVEESNGVSALVLELVEGPTLADRIAQGPIPLDEALPIAKQIAEALEAAHDQGVIHRDLKPANIKVRPDGTVKILDFGLAKLAATEPAAGINAGLSNSPTITSPALMTGVGVLLGTAAYMSPEQAKAKPVDRRADIWAFACVLYEMLTGRRAFGGETVPEVLAKILEHDPDFTRLPSHISLRLVRLLRRCLEKDPRRRLRDIGEARIELDDALSSGADKEVLPAKKPRRYVLLTSAAVVSLAIALLMVPAMRYWRTPPADEVRLELNTPGSLDPYSLALSPDGRQLAFVATDEGGTRLWLRPLDQTTAHPLAGTEGATDPFWAPDSRSIGFSDGRRVKRIDLAGGAPQVLADLTTLHATPGEPRASSATPALATPVLLGGTWNRDGIILLSVSGRLFRMPAAGGQAVAVTSPLEGQVGHTFPQFLPDDEQFLFYAEGRPELSGIFLGSLDGSVPKRLAPADSPAQHAPPGVLFYMRQNALVATRFDAARGELVGDPVTVADSLTREVAAPAAFSVSVAGPLAYHAATQRYRWTWLDRAGREIGAVSEPNEAAASTQDPALSPDGRRLAVARSVQSNRDIWLIETARGVATRFTFGAATDADPVWSPDGGRIVFRSNVDLREKPADGTGSDEVLLESGHTKAPQDWSSDGRFLLYADQDPKTGRDLWLLPMMGDRTPRVFARTEFEEWNGQFSPDGRWVAYQSDLSGRSEIYVRLFSGFDGQWQVSTNGGRMPRWRRDGQELYYIAPDGKLMAVSVRMSETTLDAGTPVEMFDTRTGATIVRTVYAVAADGRFLFNVPVAERTTSAITVILNWTGLRK